MKKGASVFMQLALLALLVQVVFPLFLSIRTLDNDFQVQSSDLTIHASKHSVNAPTLLKEKDETETEIRDFQVELIPLIDFSSLPSVLSAFHNSKLIPFQFFNKIDFRPPLFTLHRVFII
jgi:hypothetical protein